MEFKEFISARKRICDEYTCCNCPLYHCESMVFSDPDRAEEIVREWCEKHPAITNRDKLKEVFGVKIYCPSSNKKLQAWLDAEYEEPARNKN